LHYAYLVYRTLRGDHKRIFRPDAVFYVGKSPAAYLKTVKTGKISDADVRDWQRFLWNQAVVPMLIVQSRTEIHVYTAYTQPDKRESTQRIESLLETTADALELDQLWTAIESGTIYAAAPDAFNRSYAVDQFLLNNLNAAARQLALTQHEGLTPENLNFAHLFLIRLLFVCYLIERGMVKGKDFDHASLQNLRAASEENEGYFIRHLFDDLKTYAKKRDALCGIFAYVRQRFNGSLFPESVTKEKPRYNEEFIEVVNLFLHAHNLPDSQLMLPFWAYDFSVIPIETISAVYEAFLGVEGEIKKSSGNGNSQRTLGAYYTPLHLAELTVDIALENVDKPVHELRVLDPACGSGVFLVSLFGRIADSLRRVQNHTQKKRSIDWARKLLPRLHQLYGIDINPTACNITCFSLYLALLEQLEPTHVEYLHKHNEKLPPLLADGSSNSCNTVHCGSLFDPQLSLDAEDFDIVIGNPPWVSRGNQKDKGFLSWQEHNPQIYGPDKQIAHGFMWKAPEYLSDSGTGCLLLPATVLFNSHTNKFQAEWFESVTVDRVVNFSDLRFVLFSGPVHPCVAIRFGRSASNPDDAIRYECPKTDVRSKQGGSVYIREEDTAKLALRDILRAALNSNAPLVWKAPYWGSCRDQRLLDRLLDFAKLSECVGTARNPKRFIKGQGFQPYNPRPTSDVAKIRKKKEPEPPRWSPDTDFLHAGRPIDLVVPPHACEPIGNQFPLILFPRDPKIFTGSKVLLSKGSRRVLYSPGTLLFRDAFTAIKGERSDAHLLRFLTAVLASNLMYYYLFHTNSNLGVYRPQVYPKEYLAIPFFLPENATDINEAQNIVDEASGVIEDFEKRMKATAWLGHQEESARVRREVLEPLVQQYYDIDKYETMLIEDTLRLAAKSFHPTDTMLDVPTLRTPKQEHAKVYAQTLCEMLNNFGKGSKFRVKGKLILGRPYSVVRVSLTSKAVASVPVSKAPKELEETFSRMESLLDNKQDRFVFCRNLKVFDGNNLYILKPMQMRFWSRTAALNDADEIAGAIIKFRGS